eukprot:TRINITY_DN14492_c0_g1_i1.p1 TRINITY_DN14492_c0_g1~~TRINITY_DN14492_c0_g1_i1.p1  ORF type:complete len:260 (-),score=79.91 TRINITY_DN14492_c0_g1_i1:155-934(-)
MSGGIIVTSLATKQAFQAKLKAAKKGHELLKRKCDALKARFRVIMLELLDTKKNMGQQAQEALLFVAKAAYAAGDFHQKVKDSVRRATIRLDMTSENIAGVSLPTLHLRESEDADSNLGQIGIDRGGQTIARCREKFRELLDLLVKIATLQTSFVTLDQVIRVTNRRVNALEYVVIPRFQGVVDYVSQEIEEMEREDYFRLKKVIDMKRKANLADDLARDAKKAAMIKDYEDQQKKQGQEEDGQEENILDEGEDPDIIV